MVRLSRAIAARLGGHEVLRRLAALEPSELPLSAFALPRHAGCLSFFEPERFPDRAAVRAFVSGSAFEAFIAVIQQVLIGGSAVPDSSGPIPEAVLEDAREAVHHALGDLRLLAQIAASGGEEPIAFTCEPDAEPVRVRRLSALARVAASLACEGASRESWQPIFRSLHEAASGSG